MRNAVLPKLKADWLTIAVFSGLLLCRRFSAVAVLAAAVALHEAGHLLAAWALHIPVKEIRLSPLGAQIKISNGILSYFREGALAAAGPAFSFAGAVICAAWAKEFAVISLSLGVLNLLPIRGFDGGRIVECLLTAKWGEGAAGAVLRCSSFCCLFLLWSFSVYLLLRAGSGISWLGFSASLLARFFCEKRAGS